jgi:uncharacterized membrane protein YcaP (DUF421 family)
MEDLFFKDWQSFSRVAISTVIAFITLFLFLRISGKRTLAKLNAFDFIVTVALGSTLSDMMLDMVPLVEGTVVLMLIIFLQFSFAWAARTNERVEKIINSEPILLFYNGSFIEKAMKKEAITTEELYAVIRQFGVYNISDIRAIVMELNGEISVVEKADKEEKHNSLEDINVEENI